ncbi:MAG: enoyl-CoA hydratase/isomerase family protein [Actinomycetota bacterium]
MAEFETITYEEANGVAWVTLDRPEVHNAFNTTMIRELRDLWRSLRHNDAVRCTVLTAAGERAFCTGIDRNEVDVDWPDDLARTGSQAPRDGAIGFSSPFMLDDPGDYLGPKSNDYWKPVIAAVNGMACGGAFYLLGEVEFVIAADHATFFDPHVSYGMPTAFEPIHMLHKVPFPEIMRLSILGNAERVSAQRAYEIGMVSEVCPLSELHDRARWVAETVASYPTLPVQATIRALWAARDLGHKQALDQAYTFIAMGTDADALRAGQESFASGRRQEWRLR